MTHLVHQPLVVSPVSGPVSSFGFDLEELWKIAMGNLKESSQRTYKNRLAGFSRWDGTPPKMLPLLVMGSSAAAFHAKVYAYREFLRDSKLKPATRNLVLAALCRFVAKFHGTQLVNWTLAIRGFKARKLKNTAGPPEAVVRQLLESLHANASCPAQAARDEAVIRLALSLGLRRSEIIGLDLEDIKHDADDSLRISVRGKGEDEPRVLTAPGRAKKALLAWLRFRQGYAVITEEKNDEKPPEPCFIRLTHAAKKHRRAERLSDEGVAYLLDQVRRKAGIAERVLAHSLRHRAITSLLETGVPLLDAVAFARHSDPKTTMIYYDNLEDKAKKAAEAVDRLF